MIRAARLTAPLPGAIAVVALRGAGAAGLLEELAGAALPAAGGLRLAVLCADDGSALDRVLVAVRDPEWVEVSLHGGPAVVRRFLRILEERGVLLQSAEELRFEGALEREAWRLAGRVQAPAAIASLVHQSEGVLGAELRRLAGLFHAGRSARARKALARLCAAGREALPFYRPLRTALLGPPNAGKSTFFNAIAGVERAGVSSRAGRTLDPVDETVVLDPFTLQLLDSAGLVETSDQLEARAQARGWEQVESADLILWTSAGGSAAPDSRALRAGARVLEVATKADIAPASRPVDLRVCALHDPDGCRAALLRRLLRLWPQPADLGAARARPYSAALLRRLEAIGRSPDVEASALLDALVIEPPSPENVRPR